MRLRTRGQERWLYLDAGVFNALLEAIQGFRYQLRTERTGPIEVEGTGTFWEGGLYNTVKEYSVTYRYKNGVEMTCTPIWVSSRHSSTMPVLSDTLTSALRIASSY